RRNVAVLSSGQQIPFPVTGYRSIFRFRRSFADRDGIDDLSAAMSMFAGMTRATHASLGPQMVHQLSFQHSTRLNEQAAVDGFVGHAHALVVGILSLQPPGNLLGRPVQNQFTRNDVAQLTVYGQQTRLRPQRCVPGLLVRIIGAIGRSATVAQDLPADRRRSPMETTGDLTQRRTIATPPSQCRFTSHGVASTCRMHRVYQELAPTSCWV